MTTTELRRLKANGINTLTQLTVLHLVVGHERTMTTCAKIVGISPSALNGIADVLIENGLVTRHEGHDRRKKILRSTQAGEELTK